MAAQERALMRAAASQGASTPAAVRPSDRARFTILSPSEINAIEADWADLAANAVEANPFFAPWMLAPALRHLGGEKAKLVCLWDGPRLIGLLPVTRTVGYARLPVAFLESWIYEHCFYGAPLMRRGSEKAFFEALFAFIDAQAPFGGFLRLPLLDAKGPFTRGLNGAAGRRFHYIAGEFERAILHGGYETQAFLAENMRNKKASEMRRRRKKLSEIGEVVFRKFSSGDDLDEWLESFVALEGAGWKREAGTSFRANENQVEFLRETVRGAAASGDLQFFRLDVGGVAAAMMINFARDGQSYGFKICYDEAHSRYSPGVLMEIDLLSALEGMGASDFVDSCAAPDHPMINSLWPDRRRLVGVNIAAANPAARAMLSFCKFLEDLSERMRKP
ncbi:MAG: GNAT family N-acetyltransferase [Caulobacterales bacterium]|nr:GNAT family N-acetyltransferase [Caulobacterales bacterium]